MPHRRIASLWFPRLAAERRLRAEPHLAGQPLAVVRDVGQMQVLASVSVAASRAGLRPGQPLRDAHAMCAGLITRAEEPQRETLFLEALHRWAMRFSPLVAAEPPDALVIDLTGCAHLFGGEAALARLLPEECADLGLTARLGIADTLGAAWALARFAAEGAGAAAGHRSGDAIDQEAPATRARAGKKRHWERGGAAPALPVAQTASGRIAPVGQTWAALAPLPLAGLRIDDALRGELLRLGLRRIGDLLGQPRAGLARRFGRGLVDRLDQALGAAPEPVSPKPPPDRFAARLSFPDPIGLQADVSAALSRLLAQVCDRLRAKGRGGRAFRVEVFRTDHSMQWLTVQAATASADAHRLHPLFDLKLPEIDAGPGIDMIRLEAVGHEPLHDRQAAGHREAAQMGRGRRDAGAAMEDLLGRLGARVGMEALTRQHPGASHIPEKGAQVLAAAWSQPAQDWLAQEGLAQEGAAQEGAAQEGAAPQVQRPLLLWPPEPVAAPDVPHLPARFRWRGREFTATARSGPERIAPEWWFDDPAWRSGPRDYWRVDTDRGDRLWLYYAHGGALSSGWFCQGSFA